MTTTLSAVNVRRRLASVVLVLAVPALSSCAVSFGAQTDQVNTRRPANGSSTLLVSWPTRLPSPAASTTRAARDASTPSAPGAAPGDTVTHEP
jgi:hypothetical protein